MLPLVPNQEPSKGQRPQKGFDPTVPNNYPPNINYMGPGAYFKLRPDEAIVKIGKTPPPARFVISTIRLKAAALRLSLFCMEIK